MGVVGTVCKKDGAVTGVFRLKRLCLWVAMGKFSHVTFSFWIEIDLFFGAVKWMLMVMAMLVY
jgi:hypothetical protein